MSYMVRQKIRGKTYIYEAFGFWDKEKRQPRQKRKYVGVLDEKTGKVETPRKSRWSSRTSLVSGVMLAAKGLFRGKPSDRLAGGRLRGKGRLADFRAGRLLRHGKRANVSLRKLGSFD